MNIIGRITANAIVTTLKDERQVVNFSIAINDSYKNKDGQRIEQTTYVNCAYWRSAAIATYLTKGTTVELTGRINARAWTGMDGDAKASLNFHTSQIKLHGGGKGNNSPQPTTASSDTHIVQEEVIDDLPF